MTTCTCVRDAPPGRERRGQAAFPTTSLSSDHGRLANAANDTPRPTPTTGASPGLGTGTGTGADAGVGKTIMRAIADSAATRAGVALLARALPMPRVQLTRHEIVVPRLPAACDGLRVLHLSDLHLRPGSELAWQIPALVAAVPYDLACYTGDFIDSDDDLPRLTAFLALLPRGAPSYAVLGNHDYTPYGRGRGANDVRRLRDILAAAGITVLINEARPLGDGTLAIVGVDDPATGRDDLDRALAGVPRSACSLLLAHSPDIVLRLGTHRPGLILAGHTHGGQIRLPFVGALVTERRVPRQLAMGVHQTERGVPLVVSRGVGYSGLDLRIGSPPEVALLTLRASPTMIV